jgi:hypothetical protein
MLPLWAVAVLASVAEMPTEASADAETLPSAVVAVTFAPAPLCVTGAVTVTAVDVSGVDPRADRSAAGS